MRLRNASSRRANKIRRECDDQPGVPAPRGTLNVSPFDKPQEGRLSFKHVLLNERRGNDGAGGGEDRGHEGRTPSGKGSRSRQGEDSRQQTQTKLADEAFSKRLNTVTAAKPDNYNAAVAMKPSVSRSQQQRNAKEMLTALSKQHRKVLEGGQSNQPRKSTKSMPEDSNDTTHSTLNSSSFSSIFDSTVGDSTFINDKLGGGCFEEASFATPTTNNTFALKSSNDASTLNTPGVHLQLCTPGGTNASSLNDAVRQFIGLSGNNSNISSNEEDTANSHKLMRSPSIDAPKGAPSSLLARNVSACGVDLGTAAGEEDESHYSKHDFTKFSDRNAKKFLGTSEKEQPGKEAPKGKVANVYDPAPPQRRRVRRERNQKWQATRVDSKVNEQRAPDEDKGMEIKMSRNQRAISITPAAPRASEPSSTNESPRSSAVLPQNLPSPTLVDEKKKCSPARVLSPTPGSIGRERSKSPIVRLMDLGSGSGNNAKDSKFTESTAPESQSASEKTSNVNSTHFVTRLLKRHQSQRIRQGLRSSVIKTFQQQRLDKTRQPIKAEKNGIPNSTTVKEGRTTKAEIIAEPTNQISIEKEQPQESTIRYTMPSDCDEVREPRDPPADYCRAPSPATIGKNSLTNQQTIGRSAAVPIKKVSSTPSNFSSLFTLQTDLWEDVEEFSDPEHPIRRQKERDQRRRGRRRDPSQSRDGAATTGEHKENNGRKCPRDPSADRRTVEPVLPLSRVGQESRQKTNPGKDSSVPAKERPGGKAEKRKNKSSSAKKPKGSPKRKQNDDSSLAFSLRLPIRGFDDTDISALQMNDSATVYFYQAQQHSKGQSGAAKAKEGDKGAVDKRTRSGAPVVGGVEAYTEREAQATPISPVQISALADGEYWKKKYELLKEDIARGRETQESETADMAANTEQPADVDAQLKENKQCPNPLNAIGNFWNNDSRDCDIDTRRLAENYSSIHSSGKLANCPRHPCPRQEMDNLVSQAQHAREVSLHSMKETARHLANFAAKLESNLEEARANRTKLRKDVNEDTRDNGFSEENELEREGSLRDVVASEELVWPPPKVSRCSSPQYGPSPHFVDQNSANAKWQFIITDDMYGSGRNQPNKALADELTAYASHMSRHKRDVSTERSESELSSNAQDVFESAMSRRLPHPPAARGPKTTISIDPPSRVIPPSRVMSSRDRRSFSKPSSLPRDFARWFELPSPGSQCISLLPLLDTNPRNTTEIADAMDITPLSRAKETIQRSYYEFDREQNNKPSSDEEIRIFETITDYIEHILVERGDDGGPCIRFQSPHVNLYTVSKAARYFVSMGKICDAVDVYTALWRSFQDSKTGQDGSTAPHSFDLVGHIIASALHNLAVLHLWQFDYEKALPFCRESLRVRSELASGGAAADDFSNVGMVNTWANLGLINYANGMLSGALSSFRKASQISSSLDESTGHITGRLANNLACVNFAIGKNIPLVQSELERSLQLQKTDDDKMDSSTGEALLAASITITNLAVSSLINKDGGAANQHIDAAVAIQEALLDNDDVILKSTRFYQRSLAKVKPRVVSPNAKSTSAEKPLTDSGPVKQEDDETRGVVRNPLLSRQVRRKRPNHGNNDILYPLLSFGSLRTDSTVTTQVEMSLKRCPDYLLFAGVGGKNQLGLLCRKPNSNHETMSTQIIKFGIHAIKKRDAIAGLNRALQRYGSRHPVVGEAHYRLGLIHLFTGNYIEAMVQLEDALQIYMVALGNGHQDVSSTLVYIAFAQLALYRFDDARSSILRASRYRTNTLGPGHPEIASLLNNLAFVSFKLGDVQEADSIFQDALDIQRDAFVTEINFLKTVSTVLCNIAYLHAKNGMFSKALVELEGSLEIRQDILCEDATALTDIHENMAHLMAISHLQKTAGDLDAITDEYILMLRK
ncbi:hypothetical protein THAOC_29614 [Thalassiosira oceanica]|uniref:Uncharacterized protein n=1 Tax=Thalassiosira oceanica TaxID=159749 RepID=K0RQW8_THAOC|nr:hypothetical protein THAOC_29614 [Thalassiosira oceanica]|eukprot:EJK51231.1 hypothetical protein THAOC_29614 [Thalassiosira oceanica]